MSNIIVTGISGAIGSRLAIALRLEGNNVIEPNPKFRLNQKEYFDSVENPDEIDVLYHCAAKLSVLESWENPGLYTEVNVLGTQSVVDFCIEYEIKLIFISSYVFGKPEYLPIDEKHPKSAPNPYALSKILAEEIVKFSGENLGLSYNIVRPFNIYGSLANDYLLIPEIIHKINNEEKVELKDLSPRRDYIHIKDVIEFLVMAKSNFQNSDFNLGFGKSYSVKEVAQACIKRWDSNLVLSSSSNVRKNEIPETVCDIRKIKEVFSWVPSIDLKQGIDLVFKEYQTKTG
ncbi:MAG: NAD(P)-dependent oxidoreductase [Crocinitomicaceae bacterium]|nr:NAD(P)-dependent oxidoreductase [Crocinitomicaceae bacterium]